MYTEFVAFSIPLSRPTNGWMTNFLTGMGNFLPSSSPLKDNTYDDDHTAGGDGDEDVENLESTRRFRQVVVVGWPSRRELN